MIELPDSDDRAALVAQAQASGDISPAEAAEIHQAIAEVPAEKEEEETDFRNLLPTLTLPQKIKYAMFGGQVPRNILIYDPKKMVQEAVLKNPRITQPEIEAFLKSTSIGEFVLRTIAGSKEWMRSYTHKVLLVSNAKTPQDISLKWLRYINSSDLKRIAKSKSVPNTIATAAARIVASAEKKQ